MDKSTPYAREVINILKRSSQKPKMVAVRMGSSFGPTGGIFIPIPDSKEYFDMDVINQYNSVFMKKRIPRKLKKQNKQRNG